MGIIHRLKVKHLKQLGTIVLLSVISLVPFNNCANQANDTGLFKKSNTPCDPSEPDCDLDSSLLEIATTAQGYTASGGTTTINVAGTCNPGEYPNNEIHWKIFLGNNELPGNWNTTYLSQYVSHCQNGSFIAVVAVPPVPDPSYKIEISIKGITASGEPQSHSNGTKQVTLTRLP